MPAVPTLSRLMDWKPFAFAFAVDYVGVTAQNWPRLFPSGRASGWVMSQYHIEHGLQFQVRKKATALSVFYFKHDWLLSETKKKKISQVLIKASA
jgi:hypothetical protein